MAFINGYLMVRLREPPRIQALMLEHLQELMEDWEHYGWPVVRAYHATWIQNIEQGRVAWGAEAIKLKLWHALVWHRVMAPIDSHQAYTAPSQLSSAHQPSQTFRSISPTPSQAQACPVFNIPRGEAVQPSPLTQMTNSAQHSTQGTVLTIQPTYLCSM